MEMMVKQLATFLLIVLLSTASLLCAQDTKAQKQMKAAYMLFQAAEFPKALSSVNKAIKIDPNYADAYSLQASIYETMRDTQNASKSYQNCLRVAPTFQPMYFYYGEYLYRNKRLKEAESVLSKFDSVPFMKGFNPKKQAASARLVEKTTRLKASVIAAMDDVNIAENLKITNLGPAINTVQNEYWPGMPFSGNHFVFTRLVDGQEDFYISQLINSTAQAKVWGHANPVRGMINTPENEGTLSVKADGSALYYSRCNQPGGLGSCDIYVSDLDNADAVSPSWNKGNNLGAPVNSISWDCQPAISGDGHTLIFSSARPSGFGSKDLWISKLNNGKWCLPVNLGPAINTREDDDAPFLHYDGKTLYFSSLGHPGFGGSDLFMSRLGDDGKWSNPENLGSALNTPSDEFGLYIDAVGQVGYFASDRKENGSFGGLDIYKFQVPDKIKPKAVTYVSGLVWGHAGASAPPSHKKLIAKVRVIELNNGRVVFEDSVADFFIPLVPGGNYALHASAAGYMTQSLNFQPTESSLDHPFEVVAHLYPIEENRVLVLNNIFFDTDKFDLKSESMEELKMLVALMKANPAMVIEVRGHTDNQGAADYNLKLSENRAKAVVGLLGSSGIAAMRMKWKGFGAKVPVASNETDLGRAQNRRIEMVVLKVK